MVVDDSTLDKPYVRHIELVHRHWSGKRRRVACGINLVTLLGTYSARHVPLDWRVYNKPHDQASQSNHFSAMCQAARARGFASACVTFDSW